MIKKIDNFLPDMFYGRLKETLSEGPNFPWFWNDKTASDAGGYALDNNFMFNPILNLNLINLINKMNAIYQAFFLKELKYLNCANMPFTQSIKSTEL